MKPMTLKEPSPCCGVPTLLWDQRVFVCPCGKMRVDMNGRPVRVKPGKRGSTAFGTPFAYGNRARTR
jgi:hypothetical protein